MCPSPNADTATSPGASHSSVRCLCRKLRGSASSEAELASLDGLAQHVARGVGGTHRGQAIYKVLLPQNLRAGSAALHPFPMLGQNCSRCPSFCIVWP